MAEETTLLTLGGLLHVPRASPACLEAYRVFALAVCGQGRLMTATAYGCLHYGPPLMVRINFFAMAVGAAELLFKMNTLFIIIDNAGGLFPVTIKARVFSTCRTYGKADSQ